MLIKKRNRKISALFVKGTLRQTAELRDTELFIVLKWRLITLQ